MQTIELPNTVDCVPAATDEPLRIITIDDNEAIHEDFQKILGQSAGASELDASEAMLFGDEAAAPKGPEYEIVTASQGEIGRDLVAKHREQGTPIALAFVDMRMPPGWDGVKTIEEIWKVDPDVQVVICSAYSDYSWGEITERLGQTDKLLILKKPFDNIEVSQLAMALTHKWLANRKVEQQMESLESSVNKRTESLNQAVEQLTESQQFLDHTIDSLSSRIAILDDKGLIVSTNANWRSEDTANPFVSADIKEHGNYLESCNSADHVEEIATLKSGIQEILAGKTDSFSLEYDFENESGNKRWYTVQVTHFRQGETIRVVVAHDDVGELKALQGQLAHAQKLEAVGQLAAGVAHEINTPIQYIGDNARFLQDSFSELTELLNATIKFTEAAAESPPGEADLTQIKGKIEEADVEYLAEEIPTAISQSIDGVDRVAKIVRAMKEFSHPGEEGKSHVDLNEAIDSTITVATNEWKYIAEMVREFDPNLPPVQCLPGELNQVILNLLVNASHAICDVVGDGSGGKGTITIATKTCDDHVEISITDTGTGIPVHAQEKIFDPFFTTKEVGKGTGQGLAMAYSIITERHEGKIYFRTEEGKGTTFVIELPL